MENLLTTDAAADYLGVASNTLRRSRWSNELCGVRPPEFMKLGTKTVRYRREALDEWLSNFGSFTNNRQFRQAMGDS